METKKEFRFFSIFEHQKEEIYLRQQHNAGWRFKKVTGIGMYHFEKCQPEDVIYQLDYNQEGSASKGDYIKMFSDCGWDYIQEYAGFSYFCKAAAEMKGEEEIFNDSSSRLAMLERIYKGRMLPLLVLFCAVLLPQFVMNLLAGRYVLASVMAGILTLYIVVFAYCAVHYHRQKGNG